MDAKERESGVPEEDDPIRALAMQNAARAAEQPRSSGFSWLGPFLVAVLITGVILAAAYYLWGR